MTNATMCLKTQITILILASTRKKLCLLVPNHFYLVISEVNLNNQKLIKMELPIFEYKKQIVELINSNMFCIITGETGSGKST